MSITMKGGNSQRRRIVGPLLSILLIAGVGAAIWYSAGNALEARRVVTVSGLIGSEKEEFFQDDEVIALLQGNHQLRVDFTKAGSRQIATNYDLRDYDFGFPAGIPAAEKIRESTAVNRSYDTFFTPMAIASWRPIAEILAANGLATAQDGGAYYTLDMAKYLDLVERDVRWSDLEANGAYNVNKRVLISSTDIRKSNSAAMYLALASYVWNGNTIVQSANEPGLLAKLEKLFFEQGFTEYSSEAPFEDYLAMGMGKAPMVMIYEAQFITHTVQSASTINPEMVLIYPEPTVFTKHVLVGLTEEGYRLGEALQTDPELQRLAMQYGLRSSNSEALNTFWEEHNLQLPKNLINVIDPPSYEALEGIIQQIEAKYN